MPSRSRHPDVEQDDLRAAGPTVSCSAWPPEQPPTTSRSGAEPTIRARPDRTSTSSSTIRTRIGGMVLLGRAWLAPEPTARPDGLPGPPAGAGTPADRRGSESATGSTRFSSGLGNHGTRSPTAGPARSRTGDAGRSVVPPRVSYGCGPHVDRLELELCPL